MNSNSDNKQKFDHSNPYEVLETTNNNNSSIFKDISIEEPIDQINLHIEKEKIVNLDNLITNRNSVNAPSRIGNLRILKYNRHGDPVIVIGPHWPFYVCLSTTIFLIFFFFLYCMWNYMTFPIKLGGFLIYLVQSGTYTYVFLIDPGIPKKFLMMRNTNTQDKLDEGFKFCNKCKIATSISTKTNHCIDCDVCIVGYDHHCPWTSKCIGKGNILQFYAFVLSTMVMFGYIIFAFSMIS